MAKPGTLPKFAEEDLVDGTSGVNNVLTPPVGIQDNGWNPAGMFPKRQFDNWFKRWAYRWLRFMDEELTEQVNFMRVEETIAMETHPSDFNPQQFFDLLCIRNIPTINGKVINKGTLVFSPIDFETGNVIDLDINTDPITSVPFNTDHLTTINDLITQIVAHADVDSAFLDSRDTDDRTIVVTAVGGEDVDITNILVTGGASQALGAWRKVFDELLTVSFPRIITTSLSTSFRMRPLNWPTGEWPDWFVVAALDKWAIPAVAFDNGGMYNGAISWPYYGSFLWFEKPDSNGLLDSGGWTASGDKGWQAQTFTIRTKDTIDGGAVP